MSDPKIVDLAEQRSAVGRQRRAKMLSKLKPPAWVVAWGLFLTIAGVGYFWMSYPGTQRADLTGVSEFDGGIATCGLIRRTCLVDGDTGWQDGVKWRLLSVDTPELGNPECPRERELAEAASKRLVELMSPGYAISWSDRRDQYKRELVTIRSKDGRDIGEVLKGEGLAQPWPNQGNVWCGR